MWIGQSLTTPGLYLFCSHSYLILTNHFEMCWFVASECFFSRLLPRTLHLKMKYYTSSRQTDKQIVVFFLIWVYWLNGSILNFQTIELIRKQRIVEFTVTQGFEFFSQLQSSMSFDSFQQWFEVVLLFKPSCQMIEFGSDNFRFHFLIHRHELDVKILNK